jgi:hypothetical protein
MTKNKTCAKCEKQKPRKEFYNNARTLDGLGSYCKVCSNKQAKIHRRDNYEKYLETSRRYRQNNIDRIAAYQEIYYAVPEIKEKTAKYQKEYQKKNRKKLTEYMAAYVAENKEAIKKRALDNYYKNRDKILLANKAKRFAKKLAKSKKK